MIKIAIVEDENYYVTQLREMLYKWSIGKDQVDITTFSSGEEMLQSYRLHNNGYSVIFLDIKLGGITGLETAKLLRELGYENQIIFITSYEEFAREGYQVSALNYLVKPTNYEEVSACMDKIDIAANFSFNFKGDYVKIPYNDILYFESEKHYLRIYTIHLALEDVPLRFRFNMSQLKNSSLPNRFIQCHRSYVVNVVHVMKIKEKTIYLRNGTKLPIGSFYLDEFIEHYQKYTF